LTEIYSVILYTAFKLIATPKLREHTTLWNTTMKTGWSLILHHVLIKSSPYT